MVTKVLVIRFSSIGDIVLTTPVLRCLKNQFDGEIEIHYLTKNSYKHLIEPNPYVNKVWGIDKTTSEIASDLVNEGFTYIFDLHHNLRSSRVKRKLKTLAFSFPKLNIEKWLLVNFKINKLPEQHIVDRYMETVSSFGIKYDGEGLDYFIPESEHVDIPALDASLSNGYVTFAIGGNYTTKKLPTEKIIEVCRQIKLPVVLIGGKEDEAESKKIASLVGDKVIDTCGRMSIHQSASIIKQTNHVISHDTGMMHIAAAFNKPIVSIWGNTIPEFGMTPFMKDPSKSKIMQVPDLRCRPCSKLGHSKCPKKHFYCMTLLDSDEIANAVN